MDNIDDMGKELQEDAVKGKAMLEELRNKNITPADIPQEVVDEMSLNSVGGVLYTRTDMSQDYDTYLEAFKKEARDAYAKSDKSVSFVDFLERYVE